jgi:hypothetical protein
MASIRIEKRHCDLAFGLHELDEGRIVGEGFEFFAGMEAGVGKTLFRRLAEEIDRVFLVTEKGGDPSLPIRQGSVKIRPLILLELLSDLQCCVLISLPARDRPEISQITDTGGDITMESLEQRDVFFDSVKDPVPTCPSPLEL